MSNHDYIKFGTSSWAFEGWQGNVYQIKYPPGRFKKDCLREYWQDVRFSTVGMDLFFYNPPGESLLKQYANQFLDDNNFKACSKVWQEITIKRFPNQSQWGKRQGQMNDNFLNAELFNEKILSVHRKAFERQTGPFIFEFQYMRKDDITRQQFINDVDVFLSKLANDFQYSIELRNKNFLCPDYFDVLREHNVAHVFNQWTYMPPISEQLKFDSITADFLLARILTPLGMSYQETVRKFEPYNRIVERQPGMREDVMTLAEIAIKEKKYAYLLINNRIEGCAPDTIKEIQKEMKSRFK
ncbi:MAG: DUF72 domain-containing protein [candidate division KSB1 bacterium]|jgi:uncharacterized protein YecE (DUF72 family)|nr:DUF72 domain-containing protein [candidate division KSB1 bacterium]